MDLSKKAKTNRDQVESPLWRIEQIMDALEESITRTDAALKVYRETDRTLSPALKRQQLAWKELQALKDELSALWKSGAAKMWKNVDK